MQSTIKLLGFIITCALCGQTVLANNQSSNITLEKQRTLFVSAEQAIRSKNSQQYNQLKKQLVDYPLYPYLIYKQLRNNLHQQSADSIRQFLNNYSDTPLARRLLSAWLSQLAKKQQWPEFLAFYQDDFGTKLKCHYLHALLKTGQQQQAWPQITEIWLHNKSRPSECDPVLAQWKKAGFQTTTLIWERIALALNANQVSLARYLAKSLQSNDKDFFEQWLKLRAKPETLSRQAIASDHPYRQQALAESVQKLARKDLPGAIAIWENLKNDVIYQPQLISNVERTLSLQFLDKPTGKLFDYLVFAEPCHEDTKLQEIRIRAALLNLQWENALLWLDRLPETHRTDDRWMYWRARSLQMTGKTDQANEIFDAVAKNRSFYGFMAADIRNKAYTLNHTQLLVDPALIQQISNRPALQRAKELLALKRYLQARREWYFISNTFNQEELLAAAKVAHDWQWHDRAILTLAKAKSWDDLAIRFPIEHKQHVFNEAKNSEIDPAWIYAMMRQESAFMHDAQSSAGALGLMQLMPRTAKSVAKKLQQRHPSKRDLFKPEKNIKLGTAYLNQVYKQFNLHPVLAIAAYNAGPHRVKRWLPQSTMPADIWIEMVPYKETRKYLKSVLAYTVIYSEKLGIDNIKMIERMPDIANRLSGMAVASTKQAVVTETN